MDLKRQIKKLKTFNNFKDGMMRDEINQAYLFLSPDRLTNKSLLLELAKLLLCKSHSACEVCNVCAKINAGTHPDVLVYPKSSMFMVDDATSIYDNVQVKPMLADYKIFVINDIDNSTEQAQNKMLKILEDPPANVIFMLSAVNQENILKTILSRTIKITVDKMEHADIKEIFSNVSEDILNIALVFGDGYVGKTEGIINDNQFLEDYENMHNLIKNMKNSSQIPFFSPFFSKDKTIFANNLVILNEMYRDLLMQSLGKNNLCTLCLNNEILQEYSAVALTNILKRINKIKQELDSNVSLTLLADNFLLEILEIKYLCK